LTDEERRTLELLEANHGFPGEYSLSVIAFNRPELTEAILLAVAEELGAPVSAEARQETPSAGGKYVSHRLRLSCREAAQVLRLYARLRRVDGVVTVL
jgi:putative lipoic acid-binding regulatory protein